MPAGARQLHHEVELAAIIGTRCRRLASDDEALAAVAGFCVALDMTDREAQTAAKAKGLPWCVAKGHDTFCPLSAPFAAASFRRGGGRTMTSTYSYFFVVFRWASSP